MPEVLAELRAASVHFPVREGVLLPREVARVRAVESVSLQVRRGEVLGLVGESGSGKSTTGRALLRLLDVTSGSVHFAGQDITHWRRQRLQAVRAKMTVVFQDPAASCNPRMRVADAIAEPLRVHTRLTTGELQHKVAGLLDQVGLDPGFAQAWPHELSGGQKQRVGIARALATDPELVVLDEPISALDVSIQAQVLNLLADLRRERGLSYLFIAHDLAAVAQLCDRVAVLYLGRVVETGDVGPVLDDPRHPYTRALLQSVPLHDPVAARQRGLRVLDGEIPSPLAFPMGCPFHPRCPQAQPSCRQDVPVLRAFSGREVACPVVQAAAQVPIAS